VVIDVDGLELVAVLPPDVSRRDDVLVPLKAAANADA
jgi:hypothetical protein